MNSIEHRAKILDAISLADNAGFSGTADALRAILPDVGKAILMQQWDEDIVQQAQPDFIQSYMRI